MANLYVEITGNFFWKIYKDMHRDTFMSAKDAQAHGIVDMVGCEGIIGKKTQVLH